MALTPQTIAAALAHRPELPKRTLSPQASDTGSFKTVLTSQLGANKSLLDGKVSVDPMAAMARMPVVPPGVNQAVKQAEAARPATTGQPKGQPPAQPKGQEVRATINRNARHPEDLGHLPNSVAKTVQQGGFTKEEENLLLAAAAAESKFLAAKRNAARARKENANTPAIGSLCAAYESGSAIDAIGYDGKGGTSYGKYQIASGVGTMDRFLDYLEQKAPDISKRLETSGPANSGARQGAMADEWKRIAAEQPKRFEALQHEFISDTHYQPALKSITLSAGEDMSKRSQAVREVLWSTAVQHGPNGATEIFTQALEKLQATGQQGNDKALIEEVYAQRMTQFGGRGRIRSAVTARLADEKETALSILNGRSLG